MGSVREEENKPKEGLRMWRELTTQIRKKSKARMQSTDFLKKEQKSLMRPSSRCSGRDQSTGDSGQNPECCSFQRAATSDHKHLEQRIQGPGARMGECVGVTRKPIHDSNGE